MKASVHTSDDYFMHYIPLFAYCFNRLYPEVEIHATIYGHADDITKTAAKGMPFLHIHENGQKIPPAIGRFIHIPDGEVIVADVDILFMAPGLIEYCKRMAKQLGTPFYAAHGARKKPKRFPDSWYGDKERLCGAFVYLTQEWTDRTRPFREATFSALINGKLQEYREEDEVILCNFCKFASYPINQEKYFPLQHRGVHLGDFKSEMQHRFTDTHKMKGKLHDEAARLFMEMELSDMKWKELTRLIRVDPKIDEVYQNLYWHLRRRG